MNFFRKYKPHLYQQGDLWYIRKWVFMQGWVYLDASGTPYWWCDITNIRKYCVFTSEQAAHFAYPKTKGL